MKPDDNQVFKVQKSVWQEMQNDTDSLYSLTKDDCLSFSDSLIISDVFIRINQELHNRKIARGNVTGDWKQPENVPVVLPFNNVIQYIGKSGQIHLEAQLKRINLTDMECLLIASSDDQVIQKVRDTVCFSSESNGTKFEIEMYGIRIPKYNYSRHLSDESTIISISAEKGIYLKVEHLSFNKHNLLGIKYFDGNTILKRKDASEPFEYYMNEIMISLMDANHNFKYYDSSSFEYHKQQYNKYLNDFNKLFTEITLNFEHDKLCTNPKYLDQAIVCGMDEVVDLLRKQGYAESPVKLDSCGIILEPDQLSHLFGSLSTTYYGAVRSKCFEDIYFADEWKKEQHNWARQDFTFRFEVAPLYHFENKVVAVMRSQGFENSDFVITVWESNKDKYRLYSILDRWITTSIGGAEIDTIIRYDKNRCLLIAHASGGDEGFYWGDYLFARWDLPDKLRIVYKLEYYEGEEEGIEAYYKFVNPEDIYVHQKKYHFNRLENNGIHTDSILSTNILNLDSLMYCDPIRYP
jgi:hypothetical protein